MNFEVDAIVLSQRKTFQENQRFLTILSKDKGLIEVKIRPYGQLTKNIYNNVTVLGYYRFNIYSGRGIATINSAEPIELFFNIRYDPKKLALSQYFCELTQLLTPSNQKATKHINLLLNALWKLQKVNSDVKQIKSVFEQRILTFSGYMPNLVGCQNCNVYESAKMYYNPKSGNLICDECNKKINEQNLIYLPKTILHALRFITYKEDKDIYNFTLEKNYLNFLSELTEYCILTVIERESKVLTIYKQLLDKDENNE